MIRPFTQADLPQVLEIWLQGNLDAHSFIPASYWLDNRSLVAAQIPQAEVYVFQQQQTIDGFIGLTGGEIAGLFVRRAERGQGVGTQLLQTAQALGRPLKLSVYEKNTAACRFYRRMGFVLHQRRVNPHTGQEEWVMTWPP